MFLSLTFFSFLPLVLGPGHISFIDSDSRAKVCFFSTGFRVRVFFFGSGFRVEVCISFTGSGCRARMGSLAGLSTLQTCPDCPHHSPGPQQQSELASLSTARAARAHVLSCQNVAFSSGSASPLSYHSLEPVADLS